MNSPVREDGGADTGIPLFRAGSQGKEFRAQSDELRRRVDWLNLLSTIELEERKVTLRQRAARVLLRDACRGQDAVGRACRRPSRVHRDCRGVEYRQSVMSA